MDSNIERKITFFKEIIYLFQAQFKGFISSKTDCFAVMCGILYLELSFNCSNFYQK